MSVQQTKDGGYIAAGAPDGSENLYLVKVDSAGNMQWNMTCPGAASSVEQTSDGGYIVGGATNPFHSYPNDFLLMKTDSTGNLQWNKTYGGAGRSEAYSVEQTSDGGYILAGATDLFGATGYDMWLVKTDVAGNVEWNKTYGGTFGGGWAYSVQQTSDGGYIIAGQGFQLVKTDAAGNVEWDKTYGIYSDTAYSVQQTSDGGYIVAGQEFSFVADNSCFYVVKTDSSGNLQWNSTYGGTPGIAYSVQQTSDGGYVIAGAVSGSAWLVKTDSAGNVQWSESCGTKAGSGYADSVEQTSDGGYILAGAISPVPLNFHVPSPYYFWLEKIGAGNGEGSGAGGSSGIVILAVGGIVVVMGIIALIDISYRRKTGIAVGRYP
jgi:hypothetical protein